jgi:hypothetical protein
MGIHWRGRLQHRRDARLLEGFTNDVLHATDPVLLSRMGSLLVILWGLACAALAYSWTDAWAVSAVFALEKLACGIWWLVWLG